MNPHIPEKLPIENLDYKKLAILSGAASIKLGRYDGCLRDLQKMVDTNVFLSSFTRQEAESSTRIEGTQTNANEVLEFEAGKAFDEYKQSQIMEFRNYRYALMNAQEIICQGREFSLSLLKQIHQTLMKDTRWDGTISKPGEFRKGPVYIGSKSGGIENAKYVPPEHLLVQEYLDNWSDYFKNYSQEDLLIKCAIFHAQFEIIHPFEDGNGRLGRLLVPLFLYLSGIIEKPNFYVSEFLDKNRNEYFERLDNITKNKDWNGWIEFFLKAVGSQSDNNIIKTDQILALYNIMKIRFQETTKSQHSVTALDLLFKRPIISSTLFHKKMKINSRNTANNILNKLEKDKIIEKIVAGSGRRARLYIFPELMKII